LIACAYRCSISGDGREDSMRILFFGLIVLLNAVPLKG
jgi:hypothetical protein